MLKAKFIDKILFKNIFCYSLIEDNATFKQMVAKFKNIFCYSLIKFIEMMLNSKYVFKNKYRYYLIENANFGMS